MAPRPIRWQKWLTGDVHPPKSWPRWKKVKWAMFRKKLARAARRTRRVWHINEGPRTYADQQALYNQYHGVRPVALPGTSNHEIPTKAHHPAADCSYGHGGPPVGHVPAARKALRAQGLCLPVAGEAWHVEPGNTWRA